MYRIVSKEQAAALVKDGDCVYINCFLSLGHAEAIHQAIFERFQATGHPKDLTLMSTAGFGAGVEGKLAEAYVEAGAVRRVINSHYPTMPSSTRLIAENKLEGYAIPLGSISHAVRAMAGGRKDFLTKMGLGIYVDPRLDGPAMNEISKDELVRVVDVDGEEYLKYTLPQPDICIIKGSSADPAGNITFEDEYMYADALAAAQATRSHGGKVLVQVDRLTDAYTRPRTVILPGILVDMLVVVEKEPLTPAQRTLAGHMHVPPAHMDHWTAALTAGAPARRDSQDQSPGIIGRRAAEELKAGDVVNIGVGLPEMVGVAAAQRGLLKDVCMTVESGGIGGLPAPGRYFGSTIGPDMVCDMASQFDFYDGGGLDICFMGALEVDRHGNVNVHRRPDRYVGIGGFGNITSASRAVVFCFSFRAHGLIAEEQDGQVKIVQEGSIQKLREQVDTISFSAEKAKERGQKVLYVTERCVFRLGEKGLTLCQVYPGIDLQKDILDQLSFTPEIDL